MKASDALLTRKSPAQKYQAHVEGARELRRGAIECDSWDNKARVLYAVDLSMANAFAEKINADAQPGAQNFGMVDLDKIDLDDHAELEKLEDAMLAQLRLSAGGPPAGAMVPLGAPSTTNTPNISSIGCKSFSTLFAGSHGQVPGTGGFGSAEEFFAAVASGLHHPRLVRLGAIEANDPSGGFAVPEEFGDWLMDSSIESEIVRPRAQVFGMSSPTRKIPVWDLGDHTENLAGFSGQWLAEGTEATDQTPQMKLMSLTVAKLAIFTSASNELLADGLNFEQQLGDRIIKAIGWYLDRSFLTGTGAGTPLGVLSAPSLITVPKESGQTASTINYSNVTKMYARLAPACRKNAVWVANSDTIPQLLAMTSPAGTLVWNQNGAAIEAPTTLLGRPIIFTEQVPTLGAAGDISLVDFTQYAIGIRREIGLEKSIHVGWQRDMSHFRCILRATGAPTWETALTPKSGATLSWAVALGERA